MDTEWHIGRDRTETRTKSSTSGSMPEIVWTTLSTPNHGPNAKNLISSSGGENTKWNKKPSRRNPFTQRALQRILGRFEARSREGSSDGSDFDGQCPNCGAWVCLSCFECPNGCEMKHGR